MSKQPEKLNLSSLDVVSEKLSLMKDFFPEFFNESSLNIESLQNFISGTTESKRERYGMSWVGKNNCLKVIQTQSIGTLKPNKDESVNFDASQNVYIEGDNLEALKLLQKSYYGRIKTIYIDPPYNTGNEFIYPDDFSESLDTYLKYSGQTDTTGKKFSTNTEGDGRFHSKWLNMMYPRLYLGRNLLKEDGVIFISIDDHEADNLRKLCNEIFGEDNFIAQFVWQKKYSRDNRPLVGTVHEYILAYAKNIAFFSEVRNLLPPSEESLKVYKNPNNDPKGRWRPVPMTAQAGHATASQFYEVVTPSGAVHKPPTGRCWAVSESKYKELLSQGRIYFGKDNSAQPNVIRYLSEVEGFVPWTWLPSTEVGHTDSAMKDYYSLMGKDLAFETPKPIKLIRHFLDISLSKTEDEIALDFFAGTSTTAHAILEKNVEEGRSHKFILVQLPQPIEFETPIEQKNIKTISDLGKERIRRAISELERSEGGKKLSREFWNKVGFRSFKLDSSNFKIWNADGLKDEASLENQLSFQVENVQNDSTQESILFEILIKSGFQLSEVIEEKKILGKRVFSISDGALLICLEEEITKELINEIAKLEPIQFICLDSAFHGNDQLKANAVQTFSNKESESDKSSQTSFRTV